MEMNKEIKNYVGNKIREYRKKRNYTQKELGEKVGVKHNTISSYEAGTNEPEQNILYSLSNVLDVSVNDFFPTVKKENPAANIQRAFGVDTLDYYNYFPTEISAGLPIDIEGITDTQKIQISDSIMGKWSGDKEVYVTHVNGDSMNNVIPDKSLIIVKPVALSDLKNGDIVVYRYDNEFAIKRYYHLDNKIVFKPDSSDPRFTDKEIEIGNEIELRIKGKVVLYIVETN